jgi:hypothetical protein
MRGNLEGFKDDLRETFEIEDPAVHALSIALADMQAKRIPLTIRNLVLQLRDSPSHMALKNRFHGMMNSAPGVFEDAMLTVGPKASTVNLTGRPLLMSSCFRGL